MIQETGLPFDNQYEPFTPSPESRSTTWLQDPTSRLPAYA